MDLDNIGRLDPMRNIAPYSVPPAVYSLYIQKIVKHVYGEGNIISVIGFLMNLILKEKEPRKTPMTEIERNQINQEINRLRELLKIAVEQKQ